MTLLPAWTKKVDFAADASGQATAHSSFPVAAGVHRADDEAVNRRSGPRRLAEFDERAEVSIAVANWAAAAEHTCVASKT
jgi:hypothetical protein